MIPDDRARIAELLHDPSLSYRAIGRELGVSDWLIRKVARELDGDPRPTRRPRPSASEPTDDGTAVGWTAVGIIAGLFALAIWVRVRWGPLDA